MSSLFFLGFFSLIKKIKFYSKTDGELQSPFQNLNIKNFLAESAHAYTFLIPYYSSPILLWFEFFWI